MGWGRVRVAETKGSEHLPIVKDPDRQAEKRAEAMALRKAFSMPVPFKSWEEFQEERAELENGREVDVGTTVTEPATQENIGEVLAKAAKEPIPEPPQSTGEPSPDMTFDNLIAYVKGHGKTEGWLFKNSGFSVDDAKADPYKCALGIKDTAGW